MKIKKEIAEKYDIWLLSRYNQIGVSERQISYVERIMTHISLDNEKAIDFVYLIENQSVVFEKLQEMTDDFEIRNSYELEQIRIAFAYFIEFLTQEKLTNKITTP